jgi:thymus-specific serine protease
MAPTFSRAASAAFLLLASSAPAADAIYTPVLARFREAHLERTRADRSRLARGAAPPPDQYFGQQLDHFDFLNSVSSSSTWQQRFWHNTQYWNGSGPIFFYVEGEGAGSPYDVVSGEHVELAEEYGALLVALEHRGYGLSKFAPDLSTDNLRYLTSHQAIGDIANFITSYLVPTFNLTLDGKTHKIVTFGGSYPGALSAWIRLRLPHLVHAALSTSSPVEAQVDFVGYNDVVAASLALPMVGGSPACVTAMTQAFQAMDAAFTGTTAQRHAMATKLLSCTGLDGVNDTMWAASNYASIVMGVVQYNLEGGGLNVQEVCATMTKPGVAPIDAFASVVNTAQGGQCLDNSYADFVAQFANTTFVPAGGVGVRQWTWQTCAQFAYYQTCEPGTSCPFSMLMTLESSFQQCVDLFGPSITAPFNIAAVNLTNALLGGQGIRGTRIVFANGSVDPWHFLSVYTGSNNATMPAVFIEGTAHCRNMLPSSPSDPPALKAARVEINNYLAEFIAQSD